MAEITHGICSDKIVIYRDNEKLSDEQIIEGLKQREQLLDAMNEIKAGVTKLMNTELF